MKVIPVFTHTIIRILIFALCLILAYSVFEFLLLVLRGFINYRGAFVLTGGAIDKSTLFLTQVQGFVSAILLLTILIELIFSLLEYLKLGGINYVPVITEIAVIAVVRHILAIDMEHVEGGVLLGISSLILVLGIFYLITNRRISLFLNKDNDSILKEDNDVQ
jgi:uncharacterized membrane protein (DUF373 family)